MVDLPGRRRRGRSLPGRRRGTGRAAAAAPRQQPRGRSVPANHGQDQTTPPDPYLPKWTKLRPEDPIAKLNPIMDFTGERTVINFAGGNEYCLEEPLVFFISTWP